MAVLKGTEVSTTTAVTPELAALKAARRLARRELYSPITVLSRLRESAAWRSIEGVLSIAESREFSVCMSHILAERRITPTRHAQQDEVPCPSIIHDLQLREIPIHDLPQQRRLVTPPVRISHVVDANPHAYQCIRRRPGRVGGVGGNRAAELLDLVDEAEHRGGIGCHEAGVGGGTAVRKVVGQEGRGVELAG